VATVDRWTGAVRRGDVGGTVTITATQDATQKYTSTTTTFTGSYNKAYQVGDTGPGGGRVFYVAGMPEWRGLYLEAAPNDEPRDVMWGCEGTPTGATDTMIGTGKANTAKILAKCTAAGIAARVAADYRGGGKSDWFLPSIDELNLMYVKRDVIGGFSDAYYLSSSERIATDVLMRHFSNDSVSGDSIDKSNASVNVRFVRAF